MTQSSFAKAVGGCDQTFISQIERGRSAPSAVVVAGVEPLGFSAHWLMTGEGDMVLEIDKAMQRVVLYGCREIPLVGEVAAGLEKTADEYSGTTIPVWLGEHADCECFGSKVGGHSMEPVFQRGDIIVIDETCPARHNDIAVVTVRDSVMMKRVSVSADEKRTYLLSLNETVPPIVLGQGRDGAQVVGRVIRLIRTKFV